MFLGKSKALVAALGVMVSLAIAPIPAMAETSLNVSELNLQGTPGTVAPTEVTFNDNGAACFTFTSTSKYLEFQDVTMHFTFGGTPYQENLYEGPTRVDNTYTVCQSTWNIDPADLPLATDWALKGVLHQQTTVSANFAAYLAAKKLTLESVFIWDNGTTTYLEANVFNKTTTPLAYSVKNLKFAGKTVSNPVVSIVVPAKTQAWVQLGNVAGAYGRDFANVPLTLTMTPAKFSTVTHTKLTLPKGLSIAKDSGAMFEYTPYNKTTTPCLALKNSTGKAISVLSTLTWKLGTKSVIGTYGQLVSIAKGATTCVSGLDNNDVAFTGDKRTAQKLFVTGKVALVAETKFDTKGLKLNGYKITDAPRMLYDAATKTTQIYVYVTHPTLGGDAVLNAPKINGVQTESSVVSIPCECGGGDYDIRSRTLTLTKVKGDLRVGKVLKLSGTLVNSTPLTVSADVTGLETEDYSARCFFYHAQESSYDSKTNLTKFKFLCINNTSTSKTFDLSALEAVAEVEGSSPATYMALTSVKSLVIAANSSKWVTVFEMLGDWRTGEKKTLTITGAGTVR